MSKKEKPSIIECFLHAKEWMKEKKDGTWLLYVILRSTVILFAIRAIFIGNFEYLALCILVLILFLLPSIIEKKLNIEIPSTLEKIILLFAFAAEILGEIQSFYIKFSWWDTMLHTMNGFLCAAIGFALVDILNENKKIKFQVSPVFCVLVAVSFSMTVGVIWEFFEFGMDCFFQLDMQKDKVINSISSVMLNPQGENIPVIIDNITNVYVNGKPLPFNGYLDIGLMDTMKDLIVNFVGAVIFSIFGFKYVSSKGKDPVATQFIPVSNTEAEESAEAVTEAIIEDAIEDTMEVTTIVEYTKDTTEDKTEVPTEATSEVTSDIIKED